MKIKNIQSLSFNLIILLVVLSSFIFTSCSKEKAEVNHKEQHETKEIYYCPMHPNVVSDKPGVCPICHMDLVKKSNSEEMRDSLINQIMLSNSKVILANVKTMKVETSPLEKEIKAFAILDFAEPNKKKITARFNGRIEKLYVDKVGDYVKKGMPLFQIYSPDLIQAQNEYLIAMNNSSLASNSKSILENSLLKSAKSKLLLLGLTQEQIQKLELTQSIDFSIDFNSPFNGIVLEKKIVEGDYVREGDVLYDIADFSSLWAIGEFYENDIWNLKVGDKVKIKIDSKPDEIFYGVVSYVYPIVDKTKRTVKVRAVINNSNGKLKPNMFGEMSVIKNFGKGIKIPSSAVLFKGEKNIVWIKSGENTFEPREVKLGEKFGDYYQVISGLKVNEEIVVSGSFLLDSESELKSISQSHQHSGMSEASMSESKDQNSEASKSKKFMNKDDKPVHVSDKNLKPFNLVCPVQGEEIDPDAPKVLYKGKVYGFCCKGCDEKFMKDPEKYIRNLSKDGKKFLGEAN